MRDYKRIEDENHWYLYVILLAAVAFFLFIILGGLGCAAKVAVPEPPTGLFDGIKTSLIALSATTSWLIVISVIGIGAGIAAVVWLPGDDKLPWGIVVGSGAMLGVSLFIQTSLGFFPWIVGGCLILGGFWLYRNFRSRKVAKLIGNLVHHDGKTTTK